MKNNKKLERFKYEVAQEMGISARNKTAGQGKMKENKDTAAKNGKTF